MSFEITPVHGTVAELESDLAAPPLHEREELVVPVVKKAIADIVEALGGYLSVSANGNVNPISGETGDLVNIYITSLPAPDSVPVETPVATTPGIETGEPTSTVEGVPGPTPVFIPSENPEPVQQEIAPSGLEEATVNTEISTQPVPSATQENPVEEAPAISPAASEPVEANMTSIGQAEAQEIAQSTLPVDV